MILRVLGVPGPALKRLGKQAEPPRLKRRWLRRGGSRNPVRRPLAIVLLVTLTLSFVALVLFLPFGPNSEQQRRRWAEAHTRQAIRTALREPALTNFSTDTLTRVRPDTYEVLGTVVARRRSHGPDPFRCVVRVSSPSSAQVLDLSINGHDYWVNALPGPGRPSRRSRTPQSAPPGGGSALDAQDF